MNCRLPIADCDSTELVEVQTKCDVAPNLPIRTSAFGIRHSRAFTLVEVMISIAIALLLILGISQIFALAQQTTGTGMNVLSGLEQARSAHDMLTADFRTIVNGPSLPALVIYSNSTVAFRSLADKIQDKDGNSATLNDPAGTATPLQLFYTQINERIHRTDRICFFRRDHFTRQTSDSPNLTSTLSSNEAYVWIGHLALPTNGTIAAWNYATPGGGSWMRPGVGGTNENNFYSSSWYLGREVILLLPHPDQVGVSNYFAGPPVAAADPFTLSPSNKALDGTPLAASRYDVAGTTIDSYRNFIAPPPAPLPPTNYAYWTAIVGSSDLPYDGNPYPRKPAANTPGWMSAAAAQTFPIFIKGCSQFIVEYTGNFVTQDPTTGKVLSALPDPTGKIDFTVEPTTGAHKIRWYGFPRDPSDEGRVGVVASAPSKFMLDKNSAVVTTINSVQYGVCPLRDTVALATDKATVYPKTTLTAAGVPTFEHAWPTGTPQANYATVLRAANGGIASPYICAWGPDVATFPQPRMIRITFAVDDPTGHLNSSLSYEYVFTLP